MKKVEEDDKSLIDLSSEPAQQQRSSTSESEIEDDAEESEVKEEDETQDVEFFMGCVEQDDPPKKDIYYFNETSKNKIKLGKYEIICPVNYKDLIECLRRSFITLQLPTFKETDFALGRVLPFNGKVI